MHTYSLVLKEKYRQDSHIHSLLFVNALQLQDKNLSNSNFNDFLPESLLWIMSASSLTSSQWSHSPYSDWFTQIGDTFLVVVTPECIETSIVDAQRNI